MSAPFQTSGASDSSSSGASKAFGMERGQDEVSQETPSMRSVAIMQPPSFSLASPGFSGSGLSFGKAPPPLGLSRPALGLKPLSKLSAISSRSSDCNTSFGIKQEWTPSIWNVKGEDLEMIPDFPLERTHRSIPDATATEVSQRISDALRKLSIEAEFDGQKAKAKCKTNDFVSFRIRLYAGGENGLPVVVEVQRRSGSASSFMHSCRAIMNAAEGKALDTRPMKMGPPGMPPIGQMKCLQQAIQEAPVSDNDGSTSALDSVMEMLRSRNRDTNVLALENLRSLTDPVKTCFSVAIRVSKCVALGDEKYDLREEIQELTERDVFSEGFEEDAGVARHSQHLRHLALCVLSNALAVCLNDGCLVRAMETEHTWFMEHLIPALVAELKSAKTSACSAYEAACCCSSLISSSRAAADLFVSLDAVATLEAAHEFGKSQHDLLAEEAKRCLNALRA